MKKPSVFISYSWDAPALKDWVRSFALRLTNDGINVVLDQWDAAPGDQLPAFMSKSIQKNDFVLIVCTPGYRNKSQVPTSGVNYEGDIIFGEIFTSGNQRKFIPILRMGEWTNSAPPALLGKYYIDLRDGEFFETNYKDLLDTLHDRRPKVRELGELDSTLKPSSQITEFATTSPRDLPSPRNYVYISDSKIEQMFSQIPANYVNSFHCGSNITDRYFKTGVVSTYIREFFSVGSLQSPKAYFSGRITAGCLVTDREVFFGDQINVPDGKEICVGLSGSLKHMLGENFKELYGNTGYVNTWLRDSLKYDRARYVEYNSNTLNFHAYLDKVANEELKKDARKNEKKSGGAEVYIRHIKDALSLFASNPSFLLSFTVPIVLASIAWYVLGSWSFILVLLSVLWFCVGVFFTMSFSKMNFDFGPRMTLEDSVRFIVRNTSSSTDRYEFLARTIMLSEDETSVALLGSPIYIALADYESRS